MKSSRYFTLEAMIFCSMMVAAILLFQQEDAANSNHPCCIMNIEANAVVPSNLFIYKPTERELRNFWRKVNKDGPMPDQTIDAYRGIGNCWEWTGAKKSGGYGSFWMANKIRSVHRAAYLIYHGVIDEKLEIMHKCDYRLCVAEHHLVEGTTKENIHDCLWKKRHISPKGEKAGLAKLTNEQVLEIRARYAAKEMGQEALAAAYGMGQTAISALLRRETWTHI